jgi:sulfite oxidase
MERQRRRMSDERVSVADARDRLADERDRLADERDREADVLEEDLLGALDQVGQRLVQGLAENRVDRTRHRTRQAEHADLTERVGGTDIAGDTGDAWHAERRDFLADDREERADLRETLGDAREQSARGKPPAQVRPVGGNPRPPHGREPPMRARRLPGPVPRSRWPGR